MTQKLKISVLGAGSFGTAMAHLISKNGHDVLIWARDPQLAIEIQSQKKNSRYLKDYDLAPILATNDLKEACHNRDFILFAIPCQHLRDFLTQVKDLIDDRCLLVNLAKGIEVDSLKVPSQIFAEILGPQISSRYAMISGPTFAKELLQEMPSGAAVASPDRNTMLLVQKAISNFFFRLYTVEDVLGVELGGALKNVMALGVAIVDGLGYGRNTQAGLITRCLKEMTEIGVAMGANPRTFSGLSGIGDLILTCTGDLSRNRQVGLRLGRGEKIKDILASMNQVAEGVTTAKAIYQLNQKYDLQIPNSEHVYKMIYEGMDPKEAVLRILSRELKREFQ